MNTHDNVAKVSLDADLATKASRKDTKNNSTLSVKTNRGGAI